MFYLCQFSLMFDWWSPFTGLPNAVQFIMAGPNLPKQCFTYNANWTTLHLRTWIYFIESCRPLPSPKATWSTRLERPDWPGRLSSPPIHVEVWADATSWHRSHRIQITSSAALLDQWLFLRFHDDESIRLQDESSHEAKPNQPRRRPLLQFLSEVSVFNILSSLSCLVLFILPCRS